MNRDIAYELEQMAEWCHDNFWKAETQAILYEAAYQIRLKEYRRYPKDADQAV